MVGWLGGWQLDSCDRPERGINKQISPLFLTIPVCVCVCLSLPLYVSHVFLFVFILLLTEYIVENVSVFCKP